jgi:hypothetical protein
MNMQVLLEKSSIFTEVLKDQMDRTREKHAAVAATTQTRPTKAKQKERVGRSGSIPPILYPHPRPAKKVSSAQM